ncbi:MAG: GGDEF domain-containing protein [Clostridium sp.]
MRKKMISYISLVIVISSVTLMLIFSLIIRNHEIDTEKEMMETIVNQVSKSLESSIEMRKKTTNLFAADYLNRSNFARYYISENKNHELTDDEWQRFLDILEVNSISIVDEKGIVTQSSNEENIGVSFYKNEELSAFLQIIEGKGDQEYVLDFNSKILKSDDFNVLFGTPIAENQKGMILMGINISVYEQYTGVNNVATFLDTIPTKESRTLFVADEEETLLGITKNNEQYIHADNLPDLLKKAEDNAIKAEINGEMHLLLTKKVNDYYVGYMSNIGEIKHISQGYFIQFVLLLIILSIVITMSLYFLIHHFILKDIDMITKKAHQFTSGDSGVQFEATKTKELNQLSEELNRVLRVIQTRNERISTIASLMGEGFGAYEYYADLNQAYYSKNVPYLLGVSTDEECKEKIIEYYQNHVSDLQEKGKIEIEEIMTVAPGRMIKIRRNILKDSSYGFLEDISVENARTKQLIQSLEEEKEKNYIDSLTGIYNRTKVKEYIDDFVSKDTNMQGVMILMDLDNFKSINDQLGHMEGDLVLKKFAEILKTQFRTSDIVARLGGDEFIVFLPNFISKAGLETKIDHTLSIIRQELSSYYEQYNLSVSIGIAYLGGNNKTYEDLYQSADDAMYTAKRGGKNGYFLGDYQTKDKDA